MYIVAINIWHIHFSLMRHLNFTVIIKRFICGDEVLNSAQKTNIHFDINCC